jgi:hypothetical protein
MYVKYDESEDTGLEDNMLDLLPGQEISVRVKELNGKQDLTK